MLSLDTGKSDIFLRKCITTQYGEKLCIKNISVLWKFKNVLTNVNNLIKFITVPDHPATGVAFEEGYWTFNMIAEHLAESNITLERHDHMHDNRCSILSPKKLNLCHFGPLLGFPKNTIIPKNTKTKSPLVVDINRGLRYITIGCNCVNTDRNFDTDGNPSRVFARIPVTTEQSLNESVTTYDNIHTSVSVLNGDHSMFEFDVNTNIGYDVGLTVMFELYIE